jgi:hypothetical protein
MTDGEAFEADVLDSLKFVSTLAQGLDRIFHCYSTSIIFIGSKRPAMPLIDQDFLAVISYLH